MKLRTLSRVLSNMSLSSSSSRHKSDKDNGDGRTSPESDKRSSERHERASPEHHERPSPEPSKRLLTTAFARSSRKPVDHGEAPPSAYRQQRLRRRATMDSRPISRPDAPVDPPQRSARPGQGPALPPQIPAHPPQVPANPPQTARLQRAARHTSLPPRPVRLGSPSPARPAQSPIAQSDRPSLAYSRRNSPSLSPSSFSAQPDPLCPKQQHRIKRKPVPYHIIEGVEDKNASTCALEQANISACFNDGKAEGSAGRAGTSKDASDNYAAKPPVPPRSVRRATLASPMDYWEYSRP